MDKKYDPTSRPCAAAGLVSYRCRGNYGWIMIGAVNHDDAMVQARRSCLTAKKDGLEIWDGEKYIAAYPNLRTTQAAD